MLNSMAKYTVMEHCSVVEKTLVMELERLWSIWNKKQHDFDQAGSLQSQIGFTLQLTNVWVSYKSGSLISDPIKICDVSTCIYWPCHFVFVARQAIQNLHNYSLSANCLGKPHKMVT